MFPLSAGSADTVSPNSVSMAATPLSPELYCTPGISKILDNLYLGSHSDAQDGQLLKLLGIRRVLNMAVECDDTEATKLGLQVLSFPLEDHSDQPIREYFERAISFIREGLEKENPEPVLVHCRMGVSRSATIIIAYLMCFGTALQGLQARKLSYRQAFDWVKNRRPQISPNLGFILSLRAFEDPQISNNNAEGITTKDDFDDCVAPWEIFPMQERVACEA